MKEKYLIFLGVIAVVAVIFFYTSSNMIGATMNDIERIDRVIRRDQERLNSAKVMDEQLAQVSRVIDNTLVDPQVREFSATEINSFVRRLAELADKHKIAVYSSRPRSVHAPGNLLEHQFTMDIMCTYVQLGRFLTELEALDNIVRVNTIDTNPVRDDDAGFEEEGEVHTQYRVILELSAFKIIKEA